MHVVKTPCIGLFLTDNMRLTAGGFAALLVMVREVADRHADGRLLLMLEGGYDLQGLSESVCACVAGLAPGHRERGEGQDATLPPHLEHLRQSHAESWPSLGTSS